MKIAPWSAAFLALAFAVSAAGSGPLGIYAPCQLDRVNRRLCGQVIDYTHNHGCDRRIWSEALQQQRDLYIYLPPGYDPHLQYPAVLWLHTFREDEIGVLEGVIPLFDQAMATGKLPPFIMICPDGSIRGRRSFLQAGSFFVNSDAGNFEDFVIQDVWEFALRTYAIRPEREAHVIMGASMGGFGAYNLGIKYRDKFKVVVGVFPPLNLRWVDCHGRYMRNFDPACWGWRTELRPREPVARFVGLVAVRLNQLIDPLYGRDPQAIHRISAENPIEMLECRDVKPGELAMYVAYSGKDQFNIDAQVESFLFVARHRGLDVCVGYLPHGRHSMPAALRLFPGVVDWLAPRLAPFAPGWTTE